MGRANQAASHLPSFAPAVPPTLRAPPATSAWLRQSAQWFLLCQDVPLLGGRPDSSLASTLRHRDPYPQHPGQETRTVAFLMAFPPQTSLVAPNPPLPPPRRSSCQQGLECSSSSGARWVGGCFSAGWAATPGGAHPGLSSVACRNLADGDRGCLHPLCGLRVPSFPTTPSSAG